MKKVIGSLLIAGGIALGVYVGVWVMFIGGIVGLVDAVGSLSEGTAISGKAVGFDILKVIFAGLVGWVSALLLIFPGWAMIVDSKPRKRGW